MGPDTSGRSVFAVDRTPRNLALLASIMEREGFGVLPAADYAEFDRHLGCSMLPELAVVRRGGFDSGVLGTLRATALGRHTDRRGLADAQRLADAGKPDARGPGCLDSPGRRATITGLIRSLLRD